MRVAFVLPAPARVPQGGAAVVYRHADGLAARGHDVVVIAPRRGRGVVQVLRSGVVAARDALHGVRGALPLAPASAAVLEPDVLGDVDLGVFDAVIATGHQTAQPVHQRAKERGVYFLQGDERHLSETAEATWHLPLVRIAVSDWVAGLVRARGLPVLGVVPNAADPGDWGVDTEPADRARTVIALYHRHAVKGPATLIAALRGLRDRVPDLAATVVSARPPNHRLPHWVDVVVRPSRPDLRALYNRSAVCLHTSVSEGWGLVPMEAAACGCAVVATASRGPREFLTPPESMAEVPVGDVDGLVRESERLLCDPAGRARQAWAGHRSVGRFDWDRSTATFEDLLVRSRP